MAKITANGATEVAKVRAIKPGYYSQYLFAINSKGVVLWRTTGEYGTGYTVYERNVQPATKISLVALIVSRGYKVIGDA